MAEANSGARGDTPTVYRTVTAGSLTAGSATTPARCAVKLIISNSDESAEATAVFQGPDAVNVTVTVPASSTIELCGHFAVLGTLAAGITVVAGWLDDGAFPKNP